MRDDYRTEYLRLVAVSYSGDGDLVLARERLQALGGDPYTAPLVDVTEQWIQEGRNADLIAPFARLARAMGVDTPEMAVYLSGDTG